MARLSNKSKSNQPEKVVVKPPHPLIALALGVFGYLLWIRLNLFIQSQPPHYHDLPENFAPPKKVKPAQKKIDLSKFADSFYSAFSTDDGIRNDERDGFEVKFQDQTTKETCYCDVVTMDCLDTLKCMKDLHNPQQRQARAWLGTEFRRMIKQTSKFKKEWNGSWGETPLGKSLQYHTLDAYVTWRKTNYLPKYGDELPSIFVDPARYPECIHDNGKFFPKIIHDGQSCIYNKIDKKEDTAGAIIENGAKQWYNATYKNSAKIRNKVREQLKDFLAVHQPEGTGDNDFRDETSWSVDFNEPVTYEKQLTPLGSLMVFAHLCRMLFNRKEFMHEIYEEQLTAVTNPSSTVAHKPKGKSVDDEPFIVSVHIRRADSCADRRRSRFQKQASKLDSQAQHGSARMCYDISVYLEAVMRIREMVPKTRPLHVYLATDDVNNIMHEVFSTDFSVKKARPKSLRSESNEEKTEEKESEEEREMIPIDIDKVDKWHFLNISRDHFDFVADSIEAIENQANQPKLGESAITDLWLLSHGNAFVGHLGSRYGKVAWLLMTARRNSFIPFFSADGHSFCCEIDENCGKMKKYMTNENCLAFGHEYHNYDHEDYWGVGSVARKEFYEKQHNTKYLEDRIEDLKHKSKTRIKLFKMKQRKIEKEKMKLKLKQPAKKSVKKKNRK